jgi:hypothetical protein
VISILWHNNEFMYVRRSWSRF